MNDRISVTGISSIRTKIDVVDRMFTGHVSLLVAQCGILSMCVCVCVTICITGMIPFLQCCMPRNAASPICSRQSSASFERISLVDHFSGCSRLDVIEALDIAGEVSCSAPFVADHKPNRKHSVQCRRRVMVRTSSTCSKPTMKPCSNRIESTTIH